MHFHIVDLNPFERVKCVIILTFYVSATPSVCSLQLTIVNKHMSVAFVGVQRRNKTFSLVWFRRCDKIIMTVIYSRYFFIFNINTIRLNRCLTGRASISPVLINAVRCFFRDFPSKSKV